MIEMVSPPSPPTQKWRRNPLKSLKTDSEMAEALLHSFAAPAGCGVYASRTMSLSATSFASSASRSDSAMRPSVAATQRR